MKRLPRDVATLLEAPPDDAALQRVWVRLSRSRAQPRSGRVPVLGAALAASVIGFCLSQLGPSGEQPLTAQAEGAAPGASGAGRGAAAPLVAPALPRWRGGSPVTPRGVDGRLAGVSALHVEGAGEAAGPRDAAQAPRGLAPAPLASAMVQGRARRLAQRAPDPQAPADAVGHLLESAVEAFTEGDAVRAAALLTRATSVHPEDPRVPEALVTLGWLQLEHLDAPEDARVSLERAMEASLPQELFDRAWPLLQRAQRCAGRTE